MLPKFAMFANFFVELNQIVAKFFGISQNAAIFIFRYLKAISLMIFQHFKVRWYFMIFRSFQKVRSSNSGKSFFATQEEEKGENTRAGRAGEGTRGSGGHRSNPAVFLLRESTRKWAVQPRLRVAGSSFFREGKKDVNMKRLNDLSFSSKFVGREVDRFICDR